MNIDNVTIGQALGYFRDAAVGVSVLTVAWKARGVWEKCKDFINGIHTFMDETSAKLGRMDTNIETLLKNHFSHIEQDIAALKEALTKDREGN